MVLMSARATKVLKADGWLVARTEQWVPAAGGGFRRDLWGWMDLMAIRNGSCVGIQACAMTDRAKHFRKMEESPRIIEAISQWVRCPGHRAEMWSFRMVKVKRGGKAQVWSHEVDDLKSILPT